MQNEQALLLQLHKIQTRANKDHIFVQKLHETTRVLNIIFSFR